MNRLQPGANEIIISGFTPTTDRNSIKVDGKGSATITDMKVKLIPNLDKYKDVYPESEDDAQDLPKLLKRQAKRSRFWPREYVYF